MWSREELIDMILDFQNQENGGFGLADNKTVSVDMTAMALQALVPYNTDQYPKVQAAFEKGLDYLRGQMLSDCGFYVEGANNGCSDTRDTYNKESAYCSSVLSTLAHTNAKGLRRLQAIH